MEKKLFDAITELHDKFAGRYLDYILGNIELTEQQADMVYASYRTSSEFYTKLIDIMFPSNESA